eukprot:1158414-Pelagomonas_calceolata.AAC.10
MSKPGIQGSWEALLDACQAVEAPNVRAGIQFVLNLQDEDEKELQAPKVRAHLVSTNQVRSDQLRSCQRSSPNFLHKKPASTRHTLEKTYFNSHHQDQAGILLVDVGSALTQHVLSLPA